MGSHLNIPSSTLDMIRFGALRLSTENALEELRAGRGRKVSSGSAAVVHSRKEKRHGSGLEADLRDNRLKPKELSDQLEYKGGEVPLYSPRNEDIPGF